MFEKVSTDLNFVSREVEIEKFWRENDIFQKSVDQREGSDVFMFYDGPPTANGKPHIGHIETRAIKDLIPRFQTMKGKKVPRKAGWDTHGLPVELEVEKTLGLDGKEQIEEYGIEPFIQKCKESVWKYKGEWEKMSERVGYWADMEHPYITYENSYIESEWWALKTISDKGLLYKGHKIVPYCPRCGTALSSHEVSQGYKSVTEKSAVVRFKVKGEENTLSLRLDHHPLDPAQQRGPVREPQRGIRPVRRGRPHRHHGQGADSLHHGRDGDHQHDGVPRQTN